jgi:short-chain Z-isoprenyl diphosphate synthase
MGYASVSDGHRKGAEHLDEVLGWCDDLGIRHLTVWVASADNIRKRDADEVRFLMYLAETVIAERLRSNRRWAIHLTGQLDLLPGSTVRALKEAVAATQANLPGSLTIAIGYGGREEVVDAVVSLLDEAQEAGMSLDEVASLVTEESIARHLSTAGRPNPDLIIRTSGEQRLSDFLLWQGVDSDLYFVDAYWPAFRYVDLLRALRSFVRSRASQTSRSSGSRRERRRAAPGG